MKMNKRLDLKVGFSCNNSCRFCVQAHNRKFGDKTTKQIKNEMRDSRKRNVDIVFTGGEPTIRPDILELVSYAKNLGYETIQIQSNGRRFFYKEFCKEIIDAGANEFSPAVHGHIPELHDFLTRSKGSFVQTVTGIKNLKGMGQRIITNTVVTKPNYRYLPDIARLLVGLQVDQFQLAFVHPVGNAYKYFDSIVPRILLASPFIKTGLQIGIDSGIMVMAEAMPYCLMQGYENYVSERYIPPTEIRDAGFLIKDFNASKKLYGKAKFDGCVKCKFNSICEGPWREYPERFGPSEFRPVT